MQRLLIMLAILYMIFIGGTAYTANIPFLTIFFHVAVGIAVLTWLGGLLLYHRPWPHTPLDAPLATYAALLVITTLVAIDVRIAAEQAWLMAMHLLWFYLLVDLIQRGRQRWIFEGLFIATGVLVLVSVLELASWYFGLGFAGYDQGWYAISGTGGLIPPIQYKLALALNISTILGNYVMVLLPVVIAWALSTGQNDLKIGLWLLAAGVAFVLIGTGSRGALGAVVAAAGVFIAFQFMAWPRTQRIFNRHRVFPAIAIGVIGIGAMLMFFASRSDSTSDRRRIDMWESALEFIGDSPLVGTGVGLFGVEYRAVRDQGLIQDKIVSAHNLWINTTAEIGIGGFILLIWLGGAFLRMWYARWQAAPRRRQIRYEGILAALAGFCVHSTIDMFSISASVLPILIISAYVVAGENAHQQASVEPVAKLRTSQRLLPIGVTALVIISLAWLATTDIARLRMMGAWRLLGEKDYAAALQRLEDAEGIDPSQGVYPLQQAYVLGLLADENPDAYLDKAIAKHEAVLDNNPTFDMGMANLSALYAQQEDYETALDLIDQALSIHPKLWEHHFSRGRYLDLLGRTESAQQAYVEALKLQPPIAFSPYWTIIDESLPARAGALQAYLAQTTPDTRVAVGLLIADEAIVTQTIERIGEPRSVLDYLALARYALGQNNPQEALNYYDDAINQIEPADNKALAATIYAERAELNLTLGNNDAAQDDANWAIFLDRTEGARGYYVLARLRIADGEATDDIINTYLIQSVPPRIVLQEYAGTVYRSPAQVDYIPQLKLPGRGDQAYAPWLLLIDRFTNDDDPETNPQDVVDTLHKTEPYTTLLDKS